MSIRTKVILLIIILILLIAGKKGYDLYQYVYAPSVDLGIEEKYDLTIPSGSDLGDVISILHDSRLIHDTTLFRWVAKQKNLENHIHPGMYLIVSGMSMNELINIIRSGKQEIVRLTFNNVRTKEDLAGRIGSQIELDSVQILQVFKDYQVLTLANSDSANYFARLLPNTYFVYWNVSAAGLVELIDKEYLRFWDDTRKSKADSMNLSPEEIITLASIVEEETNKKEEMARIAGVYLNRLRKGMPLQADPTVKFAIGNVTKKRITKSDLEFDSPYNTYVYPGLPPGPIRIPEIHTIDAVLNFERHQYLFFCAREDFSGYHNFARTNFQHAINASRYHEALNNLKIFK